MNFNQLLFLFSYDIYSFPRLQDLIVKLSEGEINELLSMGVIRRLDSGRSCTNQDCLCEVVNEVEDGDDIILICSQGHQTKMSKKIYENLRQYEIDYAVLCKYFLESLELGDIVDIKKENGLIEVSANKTILIIPSVFNDEIVQLLTHKIFTGKDNVAIFVHDDLYIEKIQLLANLLYYKILGVFKISDLNNKKAVVQQIERKLSLLQSLKSVCDISQLNDCITNDELQKILYEPSYFVSRLIDLYRAEKYEVFEDYVKLALGCMFPIYFNAGSKKRGSRMPDGFGLIIYNNKPTRRLILDAKSINSQNVFEVKLDKGEVNKYIIYLQQVDELDRSMAELPKTLLFIAPKFHDNIFELKDEINKLYQNKYDLCFMELDALIFLWVSFFNPALRCQIINKKSFEEVVDILFDSNKIKELGIKAIDNSYVIKLEDAQTIIKTILKDDNRYDSVYEAFLKIAIKNK